MRLLLLVVGLCLAPSLATAQTVERSVDLSALGWGMVTAHEVEADGDFATLEYAVKDGYTNRWRVVALRPRPDGTEAVCAGHWFDPTQGDPFAVVGPVRVGLLHKLRVTQFGGMRFRLVSLDMPTCTP